MRVVVDASFGARDADRLEHLERAARWPRSSRRPCGAARASTSWRPILWTGFSDVIGSWKIIAMSLPRISRSLVAGRLQEILAVEE